MTVPLVEGIKAKIEFCKLIITLSTGAIGFTVTFLEKFETRPENSAIVASTTLLVSWVLLGLSILAALLTLMAHTGTLESIDRKANGWALSEAQQQSANGNTDHERWSAIAMVLLFLAGIIAMVATRL